MEKVCSMPRVLFPHLPLPVLFTAIQFHFNSPNHFFFTAHTMSFSLSLAPVISLIAGILILLMPRLLSTIVALYLILVGVLGLMGWQQWSM